MIFDFDALTPANRYKLITASVVPRPIAWVVTQDEKGALNAAPFSFFNVFSNDPATLIFGIGAAPGGEAVHGATKDTLANIKALGQFTVCLVGEDNAKAMNVTAIDFPPQVDELAEAGLTTAPSSRVSVPRIAESPVAIECETLQIIPMGHHNLVLGKIVAMHIKDECVLNPERCHVDTQKLGIIGRLGAGNVYLRTTEDVFHLDRISKNDWQTKSGD
ncbi:flavin reductase family protein [Acetobacteraceae bacterium H6797]|nr:flavin reductase family protein [Acetobacteraceae bacterium H6797]